MKDGINTKASSGMGNGRPSKDTYIHIVVFRIFRRNLVPVVRKCIAHPATRPDRRETEQQIRDHCHLSCRSNHNVGSMKCWYDLAHREFVRAGADILEQVDLP